MKERKKRNQCLVFAFLVCTMSLMQLFCSSTIVSAQSTKSNETMTVQVFFAFPPAENVYLEKKVILDFNDMTTGPNVNTSIPAFGKDFIGARCEIVREGRRCYVSFEITYSDVIGNTTADTYANDVVKEFLNCFGYTGLTSIYKSQNQIEANIVTTIGFGYIDYQLNQISKFLKYEPTDGFGRFIDGIITKYLIPDEGETSVNLKYNLHKDLNLGLLWDFEIAGVKGEPLTTDEHGNVKEHAITINLKELLNTNSSIIEINNQQSAIVILVETNISTSIDNENKTYMADIKNIQPSGYTAKPWYASTNFMEIKYEPITNLIENINVDITVSSYTSDQNFPIQIVIAIAAIIAILLVPSFFVIKKRRQRR